MSRPPQIVTDAGEASSARTLSVRADAACAGGRSATAEGSAEARIAELEASLAAQARLRSELIHLVCHELRTPITVISGFGRLLSSEAHGALNERQRHFVDEGLKACARLDAFVGDLLEARPEAATAFPVSPALADLHEVVEAPLESLMPRLEERGLKVEMRLRADPAEFAFDARRVEQVVTNLMTNAIRYGRPSGLIRVETREMEAAGTRAVEVSVEDDGPGIPARDRERLFEPYVRGAESRGVRGLGVGLAICKRIVEAHSGRIHVEEGEFGGARFAFTLPRFDIGESGTSGGS